MYNPAEASPPASQSTVCPPSQVTPRGIRMVGHGGQGLLTHWQPPEGEAVCVVAANSTQVVASTGAKLYYFELGRGQINLQQ